MKKYDWLKINSEEELRQKFKFREIYEIVLGDLKLKGILTIRGFSNLFKIIKALETFKKENIEYIDDFFISEEHKIAFMLLNYNPSFNNDLEITRLHYLNKDKAKEWRNKYIKMFHTDLGNKFPQQEEISASINTLYKRMVGEA